MRTFALATVSLLLLTSCLGEPEPIEPTAAASPNPTAIPPEVPNAAKKASVEGQVAFVQHVVETLSFSVNAGTTEPFEALVDSSCAACADYEKKIRSDKARSRRIDGFKWKVVEGEVTRNGEVEAKIDASAYRQTDSATGTVKVDRAKYKLGFKLRRGESGWIVEELYLPKDAA